MAGAPFRVRGAGAAPSGGGREEGAQQAQVGVAARAGAHVAGDPLPGRRWQQLELVLAERRRRRAAGPRAGVAQAQLGPGQLGGGPAQAGQPRTWAATGAGASPSTYAMSCAGVIAPGVGHRASAGSAIV